MRITVGYGDPARGQVRKLLRIEVTAPVSVQCCCACGFDSEPGSETGGINFGWWLVTLPASAPGHGQGRRDQRAFA